MSGQRDPASDSTVALAIEDLIGDYERVGEPLEMARIERLAQKRHLTFSQLTSILEILVDRGIPIRSEVEHDDDVDFESGSDGSSVTVDFAEKPPFCERLLNHPLLTADDEKRLARAIITGRQAEQETAASSAIPAVADLIKRGHEAQEKFVLSNLRLVWEWARKYSAVTGLDIVDLFQDGVIGLIRAVQKFNPDEGTRFSTYAVWWIRQAIGRATVERGRTIRFPMHVHNELRHLLRATRLLEREHPERPPSLSEVAHELAWPIDKVAFLQGLATLVPASLDAPMSDVDSDAVGAFVESNSPTPEEQCTSDEVRREVRNAIRSLPSGLRAIVSLRSGLGGSEPETLEFISHSYGVTRERIRQREEKAIEKLRKTLSPRLGLPYPPSKRKKKASEQTSNSCSQSEENQKGQ